MWFEKCVHRAATAAEKCNFSHEERQAFVLFCFWLFGFQASVLVRILSRVDPEKKIQVQSDYLGTKGIIMRGEGIGSEKGRQLAGGMLSSPLPQWEIRVYSPWALLGNVRRQHLLVIPPKEGDLREVAPISHLLRPSSQALSPLQDFW